MKPAVLARQRSLALQALFERITATRMAGLPLLHPDLAVRAIGFEADEAGTAALGVLLTPWFMNLVWLPLAPPADILAPGASRLRRVGVERFEFLGAHEEGFGAFECCSLFSPMFEFVDQAAAEATAAAVLACLREPAPEPGRRALLFGRGEPGGAGRARTAGARP